MSTPTEPRMVEVGVDDQASLASIIHRMYATPTDEIDALVAPMFRTIVRMGEIILDKERMDAIIPEQYRKPTAPRNGYTA